MSVNELRELLSNPVLVRSASERVLQGRAQSAGAGDTPPGGTTTDGCPHRRPLCIQLIHLSANATHPHPVVRSLAPACRRARRTTPEPTTPHRTTTQCEEVQFVDVREPWEHSTAKLPHFKLFPLSDSGSWAPTIDDTLDPQTETVVLCHHGMRSMQMAGVRPCMCACVRACECACVRVTQLTQSAARRVCHIRCMNIDQHV
jgi:hypothetical protein